MPKSDGPKQSEVFRGDPGVASRYTSIRRDRITSPSGNMGEFNKIMAMKISCEDCGAEPGAPCTSVGEKTKGKVLDGCHTLRYQAAKVKFGRKK